MGKSVYLVQALSGHGSFNAYLKRFKKSDEEACCYCNSPVDNTEHALFTCAKKTRQLDGRRERNDGEGQKKSLWGLHP